MRRINSAGLELLKDFEGLSLKAYQDSGGIYTIGYGHVTTAKEGMIIDEAEAERLLLSDLDTAELAVDQLVTGRVLSDNEFSALVVFVFNIGVFAFQKSTMLNLLNTGVEAQRVADQFDRWNKVKGVILKGLIRRRTAEKKLFLTG